MMKCITVVGYVGNRHSSKSKVEFGLLFSGDDNFQCKPPIACNTLFSGKHPKTTYFIYEMPNLAKEQ
jgi:hypothetical protein